MSRAVNAAKGAEAIHKAARERDGTVAGVVRQITRLHGEIFEAARTTLTKAIKIGELLTRVRASRKGNWLKWIDDNLPFSHDSALRYVRCYEQRHDPRLRNVRNLSNAYGILCAPKTTGTQRQSGNGRTQSVSARRHKSRHSIMEAISPEDLERDLTRSQIEIDKLFTDTLAQISRQDHATWSEFPARLIQHGNALIQQGERLRDGNMP